MLIHYDYDEPLYIIGSAGVAHEIFDMVSLDTMSTINLCTPKEFYQLPDGAQCMLGFLSQEYRINLLSKAIDLDRKWPSYVHPGAFVDPSVIINQGIFVYPLCYIGYKAILGDFCNIAPQAVVSHGCQLGKNVVLAPATLIGGSTTIGDNVVFGQKSLIRDKINIASDTVFYMSSLVTKDITEPGTYYNNKKVPLDTTK